MRRTPATSGLDFAGVFPGRTRRRYVSSGHFAFDAFVPPPRRAFALVDESDRGILRHRSAADGHGIVANGFVHEIIAVVITPHRPFETDRLQRARTKLRISVGIALRGGGGRRPFCNNRSIRKRKRLRLVEDARDGRKRMICGVAFAQDAVSRIRPPYAVTGTSRCLTTRFITDCCGFFKRKPAGVYPSMAAPARVGPQGAAGLLRRPDVLRTSCQAAALPHSRPAAPTSPAGRTC